MSLALLWGLFSLLFQLPISNANLSDEVISIVIHPTSTLLNEQSLHSRRRLTDAGGGDDGRIADDLFANAGWERGEEEASISGFHTGLLMHPHNSAVYSSLAEIAIDELNCTRLRTEAERHNFNVREFNQGRHWSRHERFLREIQDRQREGNLRSGNKIRRKLQDLSMNMQDGPGAKDGGLYNEFQSAPLSQVGFLISFYF